MLGPRVAHSCVWRAPRDENTVRASATAATRFATSSRGASNMKAIVHHEHGSPDVLRLEDVAIPALNDDDVLVRMRGAAANPYDWQFLRGERSVRRFAAGFWGPRRHSVGVDFAGVVEK